MPAVARLGDLCTGHPGAIPRPNTSASTDVFVNGLGVHRVGDAWAPYPGHAHPGVTISGSSTVFANGMAVARVGDDVDCTSKIAAGDPGVSVGG